MAFAHALANVRGPDQLFDVMAASGANYYLAYTEQRKNHPKIRALRDWILKELERG
jgi:DNA-binding transcriptional LysR family regulator